jgi:protein-tyrosine-phosphatase
MREVIMVCFGNICRSPMAEALLRRALDETLGEGHDVVVSSAGVAASEGLPPSQGSIRAMRGYGLDIHRSRSRELTAAMARRADLIYCMERYQADRVRALLPPERADRVRSMGDEVPDPLGAGQTAYDAVADQIEKLLPGVVDEVVAYINGSKT